MNFSNWNSTSLEVQPSSNLTPILDVLKIIIASFNLMLGLPLHSYILWFIATGKGGGIASEFFMFNLTICETVFGLNSLFFILGQTLPSFLMLQRFLLGLAITGRPLLQCLMCVERYLAVAHPVTFLKYKPLRYRVICCTVVWIICLGSCLLCMLTLILSKKDAHTWFYMMQFLILHCVQLFCCVAVLRALKQSGPGARAREREEENHMKRRAFYLILITTVTMVVMFVPYIATGILTILQQEVSLIWLISFCCFVLSAFVHPILYLKQNGKRVCLCSPKNSLF